MTSDNHLDINKVDIEQTLATQAQYLKDNHVGIYLIAGDLFNKFNRSKEYVENYSAACHGPRCSLLREIMIC